MICANVVEYCGAYLRQWRLSASAAMRIPGAQPIFPRAAFSSFPPARVRVSAPSENFMTILVIALRNDRGRTCQLGRVMHSALSEAALHNLFNGSQNRAGLSLGYALTQGLQVRIRLLHSQSYCLGLSIEGGVRC